MNIHEGQRLGQEEADGWEKKQGVEWTDLLLWLAVPAYAVLKCLLSYRLPPGPGTSFAEAFTVKREFLGS